MIKEVAQRLGPLRERVAFLGGAATVLLITDPAAPEVRPTRDVDVIAEITSRIEYYRLEEALREIGFAQHISEAGPICRWSVGGLLVDVMPTDERILGFSNRWYGPAFRESVRVDLEPGMTIRLVSAPYFLATKIEAFRDRGEGDFAASRDLEDLISVLDGRPEIVAEIETAPDDLRLFLADAFRTFLQDAVFVNAVAGHLSPDAASQERAPLLLERMKAVAKMLADEDA
jgi:hypothetical protein